MIVVEIAGGRRSVLSAKPKTALSLTALLRHEKIRGKS